MDLNPTSEQQAFRDEIRAWLEREVPREPLGPTSTEEGFARHQAWERKLYEAGYAAISWPRAYGGRDADLLTTTIFQEEYVRAGAPERINVLGVSLAGPTLMAYGTDEQKRRWLQGILSGDDIWCQGFSEPDAGSDLAGLRTTAVREGDEYMVNGQKIWTSVGRFADWMLALVRTDRAAPKHKGISFLMIDMHSPGIEVRPIVQINGDAGFAEVFLTDVRVPVENMVGEEHDGWRVAMTTLGFERGTGLGAHVRFSRDLQGLVALVKAVGLADDPIIRDRVARLYAETEVYKHHMYRTLTRLTSGKPIGPEASINKLYWSEMEHRIYETGMDVMGPYAELTPKAGAAVDKDRWQKAYWYSRASMIYAGTSEIQKNIIAERVLGLPKEPRA
ncbi:MAG: acyl-CoA dehydrogenase [Nitriliruptorales bacterium]|nr:acyl-CoA dehydrogenase [Nitriliruptorales bacterium]